jgi:hypothetical protein
MKILRSIVKEQVGNKINPILKEERVSGTHRFKII